MKYNKMELEQFMNDYHRMCNSQEHCSKCPMGAVRDKYSLMCTTTIIKHIGECVEPISKWNKEHPRKTYKMDFLEKCPNAKMNHNGTPVVCLENVYGLSNYCDPNYNCYECWNSEMED